jgi:hypothetical protein
MPEVPHAEIAELERIATRLRASLRRVIRASPAAGLGPIELGRTLGIDKTTASRLLASLRADDPLVALSALPGVAPLRQFLDAAEQAGVEARNLAAARRALRTFDEALQHTFGNRTRLDAALSDALPQMGRRHQETARQSIFRGMAIVKGVSIDTASLTWIVLPSASDAGRVDIRVIAAFIGVRRLRPTARVRFAATHSGTRAAATLLEGYSRPPGVTVRAVHQDDFSAYEVSTPSVRRDDDADVFFTELLAGAAPLGAPPRGFAVGDDVAHPYKRMVFSLLVHGSVWKGARFSLEAFDTAARYPAARPSLGPLVERLPLDAPVANAPAREGLATLHVPRLEEAIGEFIRPVDHADLTLWSAEVHYPIYGSRLRFAADL